MKPKSSQSRIIVFLIAIYALLFLSPPTANAETITIGAGFDFSRTSHAYKLFDLDPIPAGAFGSGSDPFTGRIDWTAGPLTTFMGFSLPPGQVDTIVFRGEDALLSGPGSSATIPVQMVALSFIGLHPTEISFDGGMRTELWNVDAIAPNNPVGTMTITQTSSEGGTFNSEFRVHPIFIFTRLSDGITFSVDVVAAGLPPNIVRQENIPWVFGPVSPAPTANFEVLRIPGLTTNFVPGYTVNEGRIPMIGTAFSPDNPQGTARGEHGHFVATNVPEPATMLLLGTGLAGVAIKTRKRFKSRKSRQGT